MSINIEKILILDQEVHKIIENSYLGLIKLVINSKFPNTAKVFTSLLNRTNFIKNSIFDLIETEDIYSVNILFRSLIEHYLIYQYIHMRWAIEKTDIAGEEYNIHFDMKEYMDYCRSLNTVRELFYHEDPLDVFDSLSKIDSRFAKMTKKEVDGISRKFQYKNIIDYIIKNIPDLNKNEFLIKLIPQYSKLSSFVHGGPFADREFLKLSDEAKGDAYLINIAELTFLITKTIKELTYIFAYNLDIKFKKDLEGIINIKM